MVQTVIQRDYNSELSDDLRSSSRPDTPLSKLIKRPPTRLVFLVVLVTICLMAFAYFSKDAASQLQRSSQQSTTAISNIENGTAEVTTDSTTTDPSATQSMEIETSIVNGETDTKVEVNGQEIPVEPNSSSTHTVIQENGSHSTTNITTHSSQSSNSTSSGTNSSSSFSHRVNSSSTVGGD